MTNLDNMYTEPLLGNNAMSNVVIILYMAYFINDTPKIWHAEKKPDLFIFLWVVHGQLRGSAAMLESGNNLPSTNNIYH